MDPVTGRLRIANKVLEGMRLYLLQAKGVERIAREERIKKSLVDLSCDPVGQKTTLRLEAPPILSKDLEKGKGCVFDYEDLKKKQVSEGDKMMANAIQSGLGMTRSPKPVSIQSEGEGAMYYGVSQQFQECSTVKRNGFSEVESSGTYVKLLKPRQRPCKNKRKKDVMIKN